MANSMIELLRTNYDERYGVVNVRPVVDALVQMSPHPFDDALATFQTVEPRWHLAIMQAMRALAAEGHCSREDARMMLRATDTVAEESGVGEYYKTINALASSPETAAALPQYIESLVRSQPNDFDRRLAFYAAGMLLAHRAETPPSLRFAHQNALSAEDSDRTTEQFRELLNRFDEAESETETVSG